MVEQLEQQGVAPTLFGPLLGDEVHVLNDHRGRLQRPGQGAGLFDQALPPAREQEDRAVGHPAGQVVLLGDVLAEVVQLQPAVLVELDELVVPLPDGPAGFAALVAVVGVVPVEGAVGNRLSFEGGDDAGAVEVLGGFGGQACDFEERGVEVGADGGRR